MGEWGALEGVLALELNEGALEWDEGDPGGELPSENCANILSSQRGGETPPLYFKIYIFSVENNILRSESARNEFLSCKVLKICVKIIKLGVRQAEPIE